MTPSQLQEESLDVGLDRYQQQAERREGLRSARLEGSNSLTAVLSIPLHLHLFKQPDESYSMSDPTGGFIAPG